MLHDQMKSIKLLGIIVFIIGSAVGKLRLPRVYVPPYKMNQENATLECGFELGGDRLYAVKWYKDNEEFFRYVPRYKPPIYVHSVDGISVVMEGSDKKIVTLGPLDLRSTGVYRCEVSAEGPSFASVHGEGRMTVVHLPKEGPQIDGKTQDEYEVGDNLALNCSSARSFPPARLSWYINDIPIDHGVKIVKPRHRMGTSLINLGLTSTVSTLNMTLEPFHFNENGEAKVRCVASISTLFWQDGDEKIVGNSRKSSTDLRSFNNFNNVVSSPVFQDDREASLLVRGGGNPTASVNFGIFLVILFSHYFLTNITCSSGGDNLFSSPSRTSGSISSTSSYSTSSSTVAYSSSHTQNKQLDIMVI